MAVFNPIPKEHYDVSLLEQNREAIEKEYRENILEYQEHMDALADSITPTGAVMANMRYLSPVQPMKTIHPLPMYAEGWTSSWIAYNNEFYDPVEKFFPITHKILSGFGNVFYAHFSILEPRASINAHRGQSKGNILRSQWCFISPKKKGCAISASKYLDDSTFDSMDYEENTSFYFDDAEYWHWVENNTDEERVVLLIDYWTDPTEMKKFDNYVYFTDVNKDFNV
tara:strand:- start:5235 stop:5912 length:678 start_codon:yes stop_codon:yes gene_type:complete